jgi:hypothetical protein
VQGFSSPQGDLVVVDESAKAPRSSWGCVVLIEFAADGVLMIGRLEIVQASPTDTQRWVVQLRSISTDNLSRPIGIESYVLEAQPEAMIGETPPTKVARHLYRISAASKWRILGHVVAWFSSGKK